MRLFNLPVVYWIVWMYEGYGLFTFGDRIVNEKLSILHLLFAFVVPVAVRKTQINLSRYL